jgi:hypothetical protein
MRETCILYDNSAAYANELQQVEQEEHDSFHESEDLQMLLLKYQTVAYRL